MRLLLRQGVPDTRRGCGDAQHTRLLSDPRKAVGAVRRPMPRAGDVSEGGLVGGARHRASLADVRTAAAARHRLRERVQRARFPARLRGLWHPHSLPRSRSCPSGRGGRTAAWEAQCRTRDASGVDRSIRRGPRWLSRRAARSPEFRRPRAVRGSRRDRSQSAAECEDVEGAGGGMGAIQPGSSLFRGRLGAGRAGVPARGGAAAFAAGRQHVRVGLLFAVAGHPGSTAGSSESARGAIRPARRQSHLCPGSGNERVSVRRPTRWAARADDAVGARRRPHASTRRERAIGHGEGEVSAPDRRDRRRIEAVEGRPARRRAPDSRGGGRQAL